MADLSFLPKNLQPIAAMAIAAGFLLFLGWKAHDLIGDAQAAEARVNRLERRVARIDRGMRRLMVKQGIVPEPEDDEESPVRASGAGR